MALLEKSLQHSSGLLRGRQSFVYSRLNKIRREEYSRTRGPSADDAWKSGWFTVLEARLYRWWRAVGSVLAFSIFMAIALGYALFLFPAIRALPGTKEQRGQRVRGVIGRSFAGFLRACTACKLMRPVRVSGLEKIDLSQPAIVVANHPTLLDIVVLGSLVPNFNCVVKHKLTRNVFLRGGLRAAEFITNEHPKQMLEHCVEALGRSQPLIIFPEGTRSPKGSVGKFSRGAAHLALRTRLPLITARLECSPSVLGKSQKWYSVPEKPVDFSVHFGVFNPSGAVARAGHFANQARVMTTELEEVFRRTKA